MDMVLVLNVLGKMAYSFPISCYFFSFDVEYVTNQIQATPMQPSNRFYLKMQKGTPEMDLV